MKKGIIAGGLLVVIIAILIFHHKLTSSAVAGEVAMDGHSVVVLMTSRYGLDEAQTKELDETLSQLDILIAQSFDEAVANGEASGALAATRMTHMQRVSNLAFQLMVAYEQASGTSFTYEQAEDLVIAGYLHDIRKYAEGNHAKQGEKYVVENVPSYINIDEERLGRIGKLIKYHSDALSDKQRAKLGEDAILEELLQDADTADKILNRGEDAEENITTLNLQSSVDLVKQYK